MGNDYLGTVELAVIDNKWGGLAFEPIYKTSDPNCEGGPSITHFYSFSNKRVALGDKVKAKILYSDYAGTNDGYTVLKKEVSIL